MMTIDSFYKTNEEEAIDFKDILKRKYNAFLVCKESKIFDYKLETSSYFDTKYGAIYKYYIFCDDKIFTLSIPDTYLKDTSEALDLVREKHMFVGCSKSLKYYISIMAKEKAKRKVIRLLNKYSRNGDYLNDSLDFLNQSKEKKVS